MGLEKNEPASPWGHMSSLFLLKTCLWYKFIYTTNLARADFVVYYCECEIYAIVYFSRIPPTCGAGMTPGMLTSDF